MATVKVSEAIRRLVADGWVLTRTTASHRHYRHPTKPGTVTVAGKNSMQKQAGWR